MLVCAHCGSPNIKTTYDPEAHAPVDICMMCSRDKFIEKTLVDPGIKKTSEGVIEMEKKKCRHNDCDKFAHINGLCDRHYHEETGEIYRPKKKRVRRNVTINVEGTVVDQDKFAREIIPALKKAVADGETGGAMQKQPEKKPVIDGTENYASHVIVVFVNHPDLAEKLEIMAKADFRTPEGQILYLISQADKIIEQAAAHG